MRTPGSLPQAQPCQVGSYRLSKDGSGGDGDKLNAEGGLLLPFEEIQGIFQGIHPSSPPTKGGPLPSSYHSSTQRRHNVARREKSSIHILAL
jgi:hypothetical protein